MKNKVKDTSKQLPDIVMSYIPVRNADDATACAKKSQMAFETKEVRQVSHVFVNPKGELETDTSVVKRTMSSSQPKPTIEVFRKHSVVPAIKNEAKRRVRSNVSYRVRKTQSAKVPMVTLDRFLAKPKSLQQRVSVQKRTPMPVQAQAPVKHTKQQLERSVSKFRDVVVKLSKHSSKSKRSKKSMKKSLKRMIRKSLKKSLRKSLPMAF